MTGGSLLTLDEILESTGGVHVLGEGDFLFSSVRTDSRVVEKGSLFIPLIGEHQDGHAFIEEAIQRGAPAVFIAMRSFENDGDRYIALHEKYPAVYFIAVESTLKALQDAAARYVENFPRLVKIGITGSSGKTTTKEILVSILSQSHNVICNEGNLNSETGLPLSVFNIRKEHEYGVFEMGMNRKGEIQELSAVLRPRFAIITNIGNAHIGILGSRENIAEEKSHIFDYFNNFGTAVIPCDDDFTEYLASRVEGNVVYFGNDTDDIKYVRDLGLSGAELSIGGKKIAFPLTGRCNYKNALAAAALARVLGVPLKDIASGLENAKTGFGRGEVITGRYTVIQDCYNANPDSMLKALDTADSIETADGGKKLYILGDMLELGESSGAEHIRIARRAAESNADAVVFVGDEIKSGYEAVKDIGEKSIFYIEGSSDDAMKAVAKEVRDFAGADKNTLILVKGSRGMALERTVKMILEGT